MLSKTWIGVLALLASSVVSACDSDASLIGSSQQDAVAALHHPRVLLSVHSAVTRQVNQRRRMKNSEEESFFDAECPGTALELEQSVRLGDEQPVTCSCSSATKTLSCDTQQVCEDGGGECVYYRLELKPVEFIKVCVLYTGMFASVYPDICLKLDTDQELNIESCQLEIEKDDELQTCQTCEFCAVGNENGLNLDCSNLYQGAKSGGCVAEDGGDGATGTAEGSTAQDSPVRIVQTRASSTSGSDSSSSTPTYGLTLIVCLVVGVIANTYSFM